LDEKIKERKAIKQMIQSWRADFQQDFARRMGWCVAQ